MFKSTGNNFGGPEITFKDYQNEHEIVLNAVFEYNSTNDEYKAAKHYEIYVPALTLAKSAVTHAYFAAKKDGAWYGTILKCWIKNPSTICIEKLDVWDNLEEHKIWICSMFGTRGHKGIEFDLVQKSGVSMKHDGPIGYISNQIYYENEHYVMLAFTTGGVSYGYQGKTDQISNYVPFPDDIDVKIPWITGLFNYNMMGAVMVEMEFHNSVIDVPAFPERLSYGTGYDPCTYFFAVRDGVTPEQEEEESENEHQPTADDNDECRKLN